MADCRTALTSSSMSLPWHSNQHGVGFKYLQVDAIVQMDRASSSTPVNKVCTMRISPLLSQFRHSFCVFSDLCAGVPDISLSCPAKCGKMLSFQLSSTSWVLFLERISCGFLPCKRHGWLLLVPAMSIGSHEKWPEVRK